MYTVQRGFTYVTLTKVLESNRHGRHYIEGEVTCTEASHRAGRTRSHTPSPVLFPAAEFPPRQHVSRGGSQVTSFQSLGVWYQMHIPGPTLALLNQNFWRQRCDNLLY